MSCNYDKETLESSLAGFQNHCLNAQWQMQKAKASQSIITEGKADLLPCIKLGCAMSQVLYVQSGSVSQEGLSGVGGDTGEEQ